MRDLLDRAALKGAAVLALVFLIAVDGGDSADLFKITVVDDENDWPVPMVELRTTHQVRFVSDNAGVIAFDLPELMGVESWFSVMGHGYELDADGFGYRGVRLTPEPGGEATIRVKRRHPGKRLGRLTGSGIFAESQKLGLEKEWKDSAILGCDSIQLVSHRDQLFWAWGDSNLARYPLGLFHMTGATTGLKPLDRFEPPLRLQFKFFENEEGRPRVIGRMPGKGPTWISGCASLSGSDGQFHLVGTYVKIKDRLTVYEWGLCVWDEEAMCFRKHRTLWEMESDKLSRAGVPDGHAVAWVDGEGVKWLLFGDPFPKVKIKATFEAWEDPERWIVLEPQKIVARKSGGKGIVPHRGSIAWNAYRKKWVSVFTQMDGSKSKLGEIWYAEADQPTGPWGDAVKVVSHDNYTFYNPRLHPELTDEGSSVLLFEGTFTRQFANHAEALPRYDYNQIMYRLDLDDPDLTGK